MSLDQEILACVIAMFLSVFGLGYVAGVATCVWRRPPQRPAVRPLSLVDALERRRVDKV